MQTLLSLVVLNKRTTAIVMQQWTLTTTLLSDRMTNHRFNVFVKCWSSTSVACVPHPQTLVSRLQQLGLWDHNYQHASSKMSILRLIARCALCMNKKLIKAIYWQCVLYSGAPSLKYGTCSLRRPDLWMHQAVRNIQTTPQTSNAHAEERQYKKLIWSSTDTIVFIAFHLCHKTQKKDTKVLNVLYVHKTQQKVLNHPFLMTQANMFSCFIPPLARNSVVEPCNGLFATDDYLVACWACVILNRKTFLWSE